MNANNMILGRRFLLPLWSACAICAVAAAPAIGQDTDDQDEPNVEVTDYGVISELAVQDADLAQVLQMLSIQAKKNIITSKNVSATVSANLYDVTFYEALDAILLVNGYGYREQGNFIYIYTQEELAEMEAAQRQPEFRVFELDHLSARDAGEFITPLLSEVGSAAYRGDVTAGFQPEITDGGADEYAYNAKVVVRDYPEVLEKIGELLESLDTPPQQVLVEATILQTSVDEANAFGIDFTVLADINFTDLTAPLSAVNNLLAGSDPESGVQPTDNRAVTATQNVGNTTGPGGLKIGVVTDDISVFLKVLDEVTDNTILARPKIMALNRQRAEVLVGARVGYLSTTATETTTTQTVEFLDTGIQLVFRPFISRDGTIRMELKPSVSEASLRTVTDAAGLQVTIPDELTNELTTNVRIRDGHTLVLGGLFKESSRISRRQVPLLGDIPVLGAAFRGQDDLITRSEIVFLITPTIMRDEIAAARGAEMLEMTYIAQIGVRNELLPFSRERMTIGYNQAAMAAHEAGDAELALYHINNSLRLNSNQIELIKLRQSILNEHEEAYERSLIERVLRGDIERLAAPRSDDGATNAPAFTEDPLMELTASEPGDEADAEAASDEASSSAAVATEAPATRQPSEEMSDETDFDDEAFTLESPEEFDSAAGESESPTSDEESAVVAEEAPMDEASPDETPGSAGFDEEAFTMETFEDDLEAQAREADAAEQMLTESSGEGEATEFWWFSPSRFGPSFWFWRQANQAAAGSATPGNADGDFGFITFDDMIDFVEAPVAEEADPK